jgi:hypothetical protein
MISFYIIIFLKFSRGQTVTGTRLHAKDGVANLLWELVIDLVTASKDGWTCETPTY